MLKTSKVKWSAMGVFLVVLVSWMMTLTTSAAPPASEAAPAVVSRGAAAIEKAAKANKYLFIFFWKDDAQHSSPVQGMFQSAMTKMSDTRRVC